jgi:hypothetical protein
MPSPRRSSEPEAFDSAWATAGEIAAAVAKGRMSALTVVEDALARITARIRCSIHSPMCWRIAR